MDKRELGPVFRERLQTLIQRAAVTRSAFAQSIGVDRSALTQLLSGQSTRLPRADTLRRISELGARLSEDCRRVVDKLPGLCFDTQIDAALRIGRRALHDRNGCGSTAF